MNDKPDPVIAVFSEALRLIPSEREAYLATACASDAERRGQVEALLRAHDKAGNFLTEPVAILCGGTVPGSVAGERPGDRIGPYKLLQQIGEGGCGIVFMAEQEGPILRRVALKLIKPGMDTRSVIARFEAERQALALMDHPSIAKVFEAGVTPSGRPFFVMELVRGTKITEYCDQNELATDERLRVFIQVCQAVQHAHQKGIIHRDIKPSNILVTQTSAGTAFPVVIDFGIAKAITKQQLTDKTLFTAFEMLIGTPAYMSPEQAALTNVDVDTRTDVYSLGVLLYELLTGSTPFDTTQLFRAGLDEVRRAIREQEAIRPSARLSQLADAEITKVAQCRRVEPPALVKAVHGDLDWIVMRALEKDRARRYETATGLALDVERYLANETVSARPPSKLYKFSKTVQRNKLLFAFIGVLGLVLIASLAVVSTALTKERQARMQAKSDQSKAETEVAKSQQITRFLEAMLQGVGPSVALGEDTALLRGILDRTAERLGREMTNMPAVEAELRGVLGRLYLELGSYPDAERMHSTEVKLCRQLFGPGSQETAAALNGLGNAYWKQRKLAEAEGAHLEALAIRRRLFGNEHAKVAESLDELGAVYRRQQKLDQAESLTREALAIRTRLLGTNHLSVADSLRNLSIILAERRKPEEAENAARQMAAMRRELLGPAHPAVATALLDLAWVTGFTGKKDEAESLEFEAFTIQRKILGDDHPELARSIYALGERMREGGRLSESHAVLAAALSIQRKLLGPDHPDVLATLRSLEATLEREGQWAAAEVVYREALGSWRKRIGTEGHESLKMLERLGQVLIKQTKYDEAEKLLAEVLTTEFSMRPESAELLTQRVDLLGRQKRLREAAAHAAWVVKHRPDDHYRAHQLAGLLAITDQRLAYERLCRELVARFAATKDPYIAERVAADCLLLPNSGVDLQTVDELASRSVELGPKEGGIAYFLACKALSEYRLGKWSKALEWADRCINNGEALASAKSMAISAMAQSKLGNREVAKSQLARGNQLVPNVHGSTNGLGDKWLAWVFTRIALDEAEAVIEAASVNVNKSGNP